MQRLRWLPPLVALMIGATVLTSATPATAAEPPGFLPAKQWHDYLCVQEETCAMGDINGDGFADAVAFVKSTQAAPAPGKPDKGDVYVALSDGRKFRPLGKWHDYFCVDTETCALGDVNGDGRADAVAFVKGNSGDVWVALSTGYGFAPPVLAHEEFCFRDDVCSVADINQDGRADLVSFFRTGHGQPDKGKVQAAVSLYGFTERFGDPQLLDDARICMDDETCAIADVNADGVNDLVAFVKSTRPWDPDRGDVWVALGYRQGQASRWRAPAIWSDYLCVGDETCALADMTGDRRADAVALDKATGKVFVATANPAGTGFGPAQWWPGSGCTAAQTCLVADVNGDRDRQFSDVVAFTKGTAGDVLVSLNSTQSDDGTITTVDYEGDVGRDTSITVGLDGRPLIAYYDTTNGDLKVAHCENVRCTHVTRRTTVAAGISGRDPSIAVGTNGLPVVAYVRYSGPYPNDPMHKLVVAACADLLCTSAVTTVHDVQAANADGATSITIGGDGLPLIAYDAVLDGVRSVKVLHCQDVQCLTGSTSVVEQVTGYADPAVTTGTDGLGLISYYDARNGDLKVAHCGDAACTAVTRSVVDAVGNSGRFSSITVTGDGRASIAYYRAGAGLQVAHCADPICSTATTRSIPSGGIGGWYTSITTNLLGQAVISHHDRLSDNLQIVTCPTADCAGAQIVSIDWGTGMGWDTSIAIGVDGFPVVSYFNAGDENLKVAHCNNRICAGL